MRTLRLSMGFLCFLVSPALASVGTTQPSALAGESAASQPISAVSMDIYVVSVSGLVQVREADALVHPVGPSHAVILGALSH